MIDFSHVSQQYGERIVLSDITLHIKRGEFFVLVGPSGSGKTTLLKILMGYERPDSGSYFFGANVRPGYFDQTLSLLSPQKTVLDEIWDLHRDFTESRVRTLLGQFLFCADDVYKKVETLSGGEKARLSLLKLMLSGANLLLLDEPTNHLDIPSREALETALLDFGGTMLVVSHDRYFINKLSTRVLSIGMDGAQSFEGGYDDYAAKTEAERAEKPRTVRAMGKGGADYKRRKECERELRRSITAIKRCEEQTAMLDAEIGRINDEMSNPDTASDYEKVTALSLKITKLEEEQTELLARWEELEDTKELLERELRELEG